MKADIRDQKFLESSEVLSSCGGSNIYGTSLSTVREVAATGKLCVMGMDIQVELSAKLVAAFSVQALKTAERPDSISPFHDFRSSMGTGLISNNQGNSNC